MHPTVKAARIAGAIYLSEIVVGPLQPDLCSRALVVSGDRAVGTEIEYRHDIVFAAFDAEHDDRRIRNLANLTADFATAQLRHHEVE